MLLQQPPYTHEIHLQRVSKELVHLGDAARDAEVDGAVADLDDEAADDVGVDLDSTLAPSSAQLATERGAYLVGDLELLASADVLRLGNGSLQPVESLVVQLLQSHQHTFPNILHPIAQSSDYISTPGPNIPERW